MVVEDRVVRILPDFGTRNKISGHYHKEVKKFIAEILEDQEYQHRVELNRYAHLLAWRRKEGQRQTWIHLYGLLRDRTGYDVYRVSLKGSKLDAVQGAGLLGHLLSIAKGELERCSPSARVVQEERGATTPTA